MTRQLKRFDEMTATASATTATIDEDLDECGPQLINKLEVKSLFINKFSCEIDSEYLIIKFCFIGKWNYIRRH